MTTFPEVTYTGVLVYGDNHVYISAVSDELADQNIDHAVILRWLDGKWAHKSVNVAVRGMQVQEGQRIALLNMGVNGKIVSFLFPGEAVEQVDMSEDGPSDLLHLRCMEKIGGHYYVAGMARRVYRRSKINRWDPIDSGVFLPREERSQAIGFNAMAGFSEDDIFAVGYRGEIWHYDGKDWAQEDSPTNLILNGICCASSKDVFIVGMKGSIIKGSRGEWENIDHGATEADIWGIAEFKGRIYVSTCTGVYIYDQDRIMKVDMKLPERITTAYLDANDDVLWSVGEKDMVYTKDGRSWSLIPKPQ